jgi:hypothetical protein
MKRRGGGIVEVVIKKRGRNNWRRKRTKVLLCFSSIMP